MNYNGLPKEKDEPDYLTSFDHMMDMISNILVCAGVFCAIMVISFVWGYLTS